MFLNNHRIKTETATLLFKAYTDLSQNTLYHSIPIAKFITIHNGEL